jgi:ubiquinone/menaquinone biosynthesis C-methylase UbiE
MAIRQVFEEAAPEYDAWFEAHRAVYDSEITALKRFRPAAGDGLEIGVGTGRFAVPLGITLGLEPAAAMAAMARRRGLRVVRGLAEALPFRDDSFALAVMVTVLCFLDEPLRALTEATRVLKPGGQLLIGMIDQASPLGRAYEAHKEASKFYRQARFYPVSRVLGWLQDLAYAPVKTCQTIFGDLSGLTSPQPARPGHGAGAFAVISARKANLAEA